MEQLVIVLNYSIKKCLYMVLYIHLKHIRVLLICINYSKLIKFMNKYN